tara:strand:- start:315 stop:524 length:210 start_codon:yes stop_codon:yes gene_type:complete
MKRDFHSKVRAAAKKASNNGKCWWVEAYILNSYLWRGPDNRDKYTIKEQNNVKDKESNIQRVDELCELS